MLSVRNKIKSYITHKKGFSIIEALFAVAFFIMALIPILGMTTLSLDISSRVKDNLIAANLAQEGIEIARSLRDSNWFDPSRSFSTGMVGTWQVDYTTHWTSNPPTPVISVQATPQLVIDSDGLYNYTVAVSSTKFQRAVTITEVTPGIELQVLSTVIWPIQKGSSPAGCPAGYNCLTIESHLFNWK